MENIKKKGKPPEWACLLVADVFRHNSKLGDVRKRTGYSSTYFSNVLHGIEKGVVAEKLICDAWSQMKKEAEERGEEKNGTDEDIRE